MSGLLSIVRALEGKSNSERSDLVTRFLAERGIKVEEQKFGFVYNMGLECLGFHPHKNHIISLGEGPYEVIVCGHYDRVRQSPGANDNGSSVAVVLGVMDVMRGAELPYKLACIVFAEEEKGMVGSCKYVLAHDVDNTRAVINLEWVGSGNHIVTWPIQNQSEDFVTRLHDAICKQGARAIPVGEFPHPSLTGDHSSFLEAGVSDAICLTLIDDRDLAAAERYFAAVEKGTYSPEELYRLFTQAPSFRRYHRPEDQSRYLSEESLQLCVDSVVGTLRGLAKQHSAFLPKP